MKATVEAEAPGISVDGLNWENGSSETMRRLADVLVAAADEVDRWANTMTTTPTKPDVPIADVHRRIRNILDQYPATEWTLKESLAVLGTLSASGAVNLAMI